MSTDILNRFRLDGQVAVVTGAGRGIGAGIVEALAAVGCDVVVTARSEGPLSEVADKVRALGRRALAVPGDITDSVFVDELADAAIAEFGKLTLWVSNAGGTDDRTSRQLGEHTDAQWDAQLNVNLRAVFTCARAAARTLSDGGSIINMSSAASVKPSPGNGAYAAAKAGVDSLTRTLAAELGPRRIRVNGIAPGPIPTEMFLEYIGSDGTELDQLATQWGVPLGRLGTIDDIANAVIYLASPAASWITGQTLAINGGRW